MYLARPVSYVRSAWSLPASVPYVVSRRPLAPRHFTRGAIARSGLGDMTNAGLARSTGAIAGSTIMALAPLAGPAAPFVALAGLAVAGLSNLFASVFSGCGPTCTEATQIVDTVEAQYLKPTLANYFALPVRTEAAQQAALQVFDYAWSMVLQGCGNPALGDAGRRCISERAASGSLPGHPGMNWFTLYRDPIANDPEVTAVMSAGGVPSVLSAFGVNPAATVAGVPVADLVVPALLILLGVML